MKKTQKVMFKQLVVALEMFREAGSDSHVEVQTILSFLYICLEEDKHEEGLNVKDVALKLGSSTATGSRNCTLLSKGFVGAKKKGMGLIELNEDPTCRIKKIVTLSKRGVSFRDTLSLVFDDG